MSKTCGPTSPPDWREAAQDRHPPRLLGNTIVQGGPRPEGEVTGLSVQSQGGDQPSGCGAFFGRPGLAFLRLRGSSPGRQQEALGRGQIDDLGSPTPTTWSGPGRGSSPEGPKWGRRVLGAPGSGETPHTASTPVASVTGPVVLRPGGGRTTSTPARYAPIRQGPSRPPTGTSGPAATTASGVQDTRYGRPVGDDAPLHGPRARPPSAG